MSSDSVTSSDQFGSDGGWNSAGSPTTNLAGHGKGRRVVAAGVIKKGVRFGNTPLKGTETAYTMAETPHLTTIGLADTLNVSGTSKWRSAHGPNVADGISLIRNM